MSYKSENELLQQASANQEFAEGLAGYLGQPQAEPNAYTDYQQSMIGYFKGLFGIVLNDPLAEYFTYSWKGYPRLIDLDEKSYTERAIQLVPVTDQTALDNQYQMELYIHGTAYSDDKKSIESIKTAAFDQQLSREGKPSQSYSIWREEFSQGDWTFQAGKPESWGGVPVVGSRILTPEVIVGMPRTIPYFLEKFQHRLQIATSRTLGPSRNRQELDEQVAHKTRVAFEATQMMTAAFKNTH